MIYEGWFPKSLQSSRSPPPHPLQYMSSSSFVGSSISATNSEEISAISEKFTELYISEDKSEKMVKIMVESFSEDALRKLFNDLSKK